MNIFDLPVDEFLAALPELEAQGVDTAALVQQYRTANSVFSSVNEAAQASQEAIAAEGRRPIAGGFASKPIGSTFMDAIRGVEFEGINGILGALSGAGRAIEAPAAAAQGLIPQEDMALEALGTAGMASMGGAAMTRPRGSVGMGGRVAGEALPEPRNAAERMARDILDMRAQGRASEVTDEMMAQADPQYMFNNTPMPMDEASRLARAVEMGFDTGVPLYHGTGADIQAFDAARFGAREASFYGNGVYSTALPDLASEYTKSSNGSAGGSANVIPLAARRSDEFRWSSDKFSRNATESQRLTDIFQDRGYSGVRFANEDEGDYISPVEVENYEVVTFDPRNIRSRFARFDPEFSHLSNLSAANASPLAGIAGLSAEDQEIIAGMDDPKEIENYISHARARGGFADGYKMTTDIGQLYSGH